jgi:hypothetical protein
VACLRPPNTKPTMAEWWLTKRPLGALTMISQEVSGGSVFAQLDGSV